MGRYKAVVEYDGSDYLGFQRQAEGQTVQGSIEEVLATVGRQPVQITGAGRTDTGVHATGQVVAFEMDWRHPTGDLHRALNAMLPRSIAVRRLEQAEAGFHPRFDAISREYRYTVFCSPVRSPLRERYAHHVGRALDLAGMNEGAATLVGVHDFASFGNPTQGDSTVREVLRAQWQEESGFVRFHVEANAFLRRMVRSIVGTLLEVGIGKLDPGDVEEILKSRDRSRAGKTAPSCGLCLVRVNYQ